MSHSRRQQRVCVLSKLEMKNSVLSEIRVGLLISQLPLQASGYDTRLRHSAGITAAAACV